MEKLDCNTINKKLLDYLMCFPFPYIDVIREQIAACQLTNEWYSDCYIIHFHPKETTRQLPPWVPTVPQGCQVLKENGPLSCQLYIESGHIIQFDVVDMGMNNIDWNYLWSHKPLYDVEYDLPTIICFLTSEAITISGIHIEQHCVYLNVSSNTEKHVVCLWNCDTSALVLPHSGHCCRINICVTGKENRQYLVKSDDDCLMIDCSLICLRDGLII